MDTSLVYFWCSEGFPDSIESRKLCWHGWGPRICFLFLDHSVLLDSQGTEVAQGKKNIFLLQKETRENWWMLLWSPKSNNASSSVCSCHIQGTSHKGKEGKFSLMSLSGSGLHSGLESVLTPPWLRDSGAQASRNQAEQLPSQPRWGGSGCWLCPQWSSKGTTKCGCQSKREHSESRGKRNMSLVSGEWLLRTKLD